MIDEAAKVFLTQGLLGVLVLALALFHMREKRAWEAKEKEYQKAIADRDAARIEDTKIGLNAMNLTQLKTHESIAALGTHAQLSTERRELITTISQAHAIVEALEEHRKRELGQSAPSRPYTAPRGTR